MKPPVAMLLAAGLGTRLAPLTDELPKPLVWLGDRPLIDGIIAALARAGIPRAVANTHHLPHRYDDAWRAGLPIPVELVHEPVILGTGGGVANAAGLLGDGTILVWNADIAADLDVVALLAAHAASGAEVTLVTAPYGAPRSGTLGLDAARSVVRVRAHDDGSETSSADYAGIAILGPRARAAIPSPGCLVGDFLMPWLRRGERAHTFALAKPFRDLGTPSHYLEANLAWLRDRSLDAYIAPSAEVGPRVEITRSVVAANAGVEGAGELEECVVWPGATARAPLRRAIVTPTRVVTFDPAR